MICEKIMICAECSKETTCFEGVKAWTCDHCQHRHGVFHHETVNEEDEDELICHKCERNEKECAEQTDSERNPITQWCGIRDPVCDDCYYEHYASDEEEDDEDDEDEDN
tara:strand:+ start:94 stop:420 length:327 start_codon:yes stop_codon:yes gene_type:complete